MLKSVLLAIRPKTLTAAIVPIMVAASLVHMHQHTLQWWLVVCALLSATFIQIATNFFNDAIDWVGTRRSIVVHRRPWASLSVLQQ